MPSLSDMLEELNNPGHNSDYTPPPMTAPTQPYYASQEFVDFINEQLMNAGMMGVDPGFQPLNVGDDLLEYFNSGRGGSLGSADAATLAQRAGIPLDVFNYEIDRTSKLGQANRSGHGLIGAAMRGIGEHPLGSLLAIGFGGTAAGGGFGGGAGAGAGGGLSTGTGTATISSSIASPGISGTLAPITTGASTLPGGIAAIEGITPAIMGGGAIPALTTMPSLGTLGATGDGGVFSKLGKLFKTPEGKLNWDRIIKAGSLASGVLGGMAYDAPDQAAPQNIMDNTPLPQLKYNRQRAAGPTDYFSYGRGPGGGEHRFFTDAEFVDAPMPNAQPGGVPSAEPAPSASPRDLRDPRLPGLRYLAHGGSPNHVRGPGGGRDDKIEALLSQDEYVMDAETVAMLGDGSPEEGARRLDEMRRNIRRHKGKSLAKGKFSPDAKDPMSYVGKSRGGSIKKVVKGGLPPTTVDDKKARLEAIRRFEAAFREAARRRDESTPIKRAHGGSVSDRRGAFTNLVRLANQLQKSLQSGNHDRVKVIAGELDSMRKGAGDEGLRAFARGGSVTSALKKLFSQEQVERPPPIKQHVLTADQVAKELEKLNPDSEVLRRYRASKRNTIDVRRSSPKE